MHFLLLIAVSYLAAVPSIAKNFDCGPLCDYVWRDDPYYNWELIETIRGDEVTFYTLNVTSQKWFDESVHSHPIWSHHMTVTVPDKVLDYNHAIMVAEAGSNGNEPPKPDHIWLMLCDWFARTTGNVCSVLRQVPNQPIQFWDDPESKNRYEDALIAWTWQEFFFNRSGADFLLRMPMTKAIVKAMDAATEFTSSLDARYDIQKYAVAGMSKRGWATWTTSIVDNERVIASVPMVLTVLNMIENLSHHYQAYGGWSWVLKDYHDLNETAYLTDPAIQIMADIIDPIEHAEHMQMPKFVIAAAGDEFFLPDDTHHFWDRLQGPSYLRVVPNAEHALVTRILSVMKSIRTFYVAVCTGYPLPQFTWTRKVNETGGSITLYTETQPIQVTSWRARTISTTMRDFRLFKPLDGDLDNIVANPVLWVPDQVQDLGDGVYRAEYATPEAGWLGFLIEMKFAGPGGLEFVFSTEVNMLPDTLPFPACDGWECLGELL